MEIFNQDLSQVSQEKRNWLFMVIWKVYTAECNSAAQEHEDLLRAMTWVRLADQKKLIEMSNYLPDDLLETKPVGLEFEESYLMWVNTIHCATEKGAVNLGVSLLIEKIGALLGFHKDAIPEAMRFAMQLAFVKAEVGKLRSSLRPYFGRRKADVMSQGKQVARV